MTETTPAQQETAPPEPTIAWLPSGVPLVLGGGKQAVQIAKEKGFSIFFMLADYKTTYTSKNAHGVTTTTTNIRPRLVKVVTSVLGEAVVEVTNPMGFGELEPAATFSLPKIPYELVHEVDTLLRHIYATKGTEGAILWTFDLDKLNSDNPSDGWGYLVPKQECTAASVSYDQTSVVGEKDDLGPNVIWAGSAHSHPAMTAFASHTDEADQAEFDGVHITYGWKPGSKETEYHIELVMGGVAFSMTEAQAFADLPNVEVNEKLDKLVERVEKKVWTSSGGGWSHGGSYSTWYGGKKKDLKLPPQLPSPAQATIIRKVLLSTGELKDCPVCNAAMYPMDVEARLCFECKCYVFLADDTLESVIDKRRKNNKPTYDLDYEHQTPSKSIWLWEEVMEDSKIIDRIKPLWLTKKDKKKHRGWQVDDSLFDNVACPNCDVPLDYVVDDSCGVCHTQLPAALLGGDAKKA